MIELELLRNLEKAIRTERQAARTFETAMHYASSTGEERHAAAARTAMRGRQNVWHMIDNLLAQLQALRAEWQETITLDKPLAPISECITLKLYEGGFVEIWVFEEGMERAERVGIRREELPRLIKALTEVQDATA